MSSRLNKDASPQRNEDASQGRRTRALSTQLYTPSVTTKYPRVFVPRAPHRAKFHPPYRCLQSWKETHGDEPNIEILCYLQIERLSLMSLPDELKAMIFENVNVL